jgi:predicted acylesterase/phospholipase RssA
MKITNMNNNNSVPETQRALVLQGGGGLGAYEVGVLKVLFDKLIEGKGNGEKEGPLFDVIAGTSMGAMNAAVLVSNIVNRNKTWEEAVEELENFWTSDENGLSSNPDFSKWWRNDGNEQNKNYQNKVSASEEALRKYYSVKEYFAHGTPRVCTPAYILKIDEKFGDQKDNLWLHHSNKSLEGTITRYSIDQNNKKMKIATSWDKKQPRLLVISVDVAEGKTVTFDSYHKEAEDPKNSLYEGDGITIDHIMASGTIPEFYDFRKLGERQFCDGGLLSNTPFRELLQAHQNYWLRVIDKDKQKIPDLEVYMVNVHPSKGETIQEDDHDGVKDRINDITFFDRNSHYDENIVDTATDYIEIIDKLKDLTKSYISTDKIDAFKNEFENFLKTTEAKSKSNTNETRTYKDLLDCRFKITSVMRIEHTGYKDTISGKGSDFTSKTIKDLINEGKKDASKLLNGPSM